MPSVNLPPFSTPAAAHPPHPRFESRRCKIQWPLFLPFFCPFSVVYLLIPRLGSSSGRAAVLVSTVPSQATETHRSTKHKADQQQQLQTSSCTEDADHHSIHVQPKHTILRRALDQIPPCPFGRSNPAHLASKVDSHRSHISRSLFTTLCTPLFFLRLVSWRISCLLRIERKSHKEIRPDRSSETQIPAYSSREVDPSDSPLDIQLHRSLPATYVILSTSARVRTRE